MENEETKKTEVTLPDDAVIYKPEKELYQKLNLCVYMREILDDPPFDPGQPEPEPSGK
jgi:hypothetical protein